MRKLPLYIIATAAALATACSSGDAASAPPDTIVSVAGEHLTASQVRRQMPAGLSPDDSAAYVKAYVASWIDSRLIERVAIDEVDRDEIDRLTAAYRSQLIMTQYRRSMARQASDGIFHPDTIEAYYNAHQNDFRLDRPMVKGIYIKVESDNPRLRGMQSAVQSTNPVDLDRLDKAANAEAIHYDYFRDRWIDFEQIENRIPGEVPERILSEHKAITITDGTYSYILAVSDYLPAGSLQPLEAARPAIKERLLAGKRIEYDAALRSELLNRAVADGIVVYGR